jgi:hypothetical protein
MATNFVTYLSSHFVIRLNHMVQEGTFVQQALALQVGSFVRETVANHDILL